MRRDPLLSKTIATYNPSASGLVSLVPSASGMAIDLQSLTATSLGAAGTIELSVAGTPFKLVAVPANGTETCFLGSYELPIGSGLDVNTSTGMAVTALYSLVDETTSITKEQARANTYFAWKSQKTLKQNAIRTPNRFGTQTEG